MNMTPMQMGVLGGAGAGIAANSFLNQPKFTNPANEAQSYLDKIPSTMAPYFQPYIDQGQRAGNKLESQYGQMTSNPADFFSKMSQGYKQSPGYQWNLNQALQAGNNAAAAGGMLGTPQHVQENEQTATNLASKDYQDWLSHIMDLFHSGQTGLQGMYGTGFGASTDYGTNLAQALMNQGQMAEEGAEAQNRHEQSVADSESEGLGDLASLAAFAFL